MFRTPVCSLGTRLFVHGVREESGTETTQSASEHATSTSHQNCVQIQYLNPSRLETGARANGLEGYWDIDTQAS